MSTFYPLLETPIDKASPKGRLTTKGVLSLLGTFLPKHQSKSSV